MSIVAEAMAGENIQTILDLVQPYTRHFSRSSLFENHINEPIAVDLIKTRAFRRLLDVSFLGAISYVRNAIERRKIRESRFNHSVGVSRLAQWFASHLQLSKQDRNLAIAAALLHDVGHPPLSHSAESVFAELFGEDHHSMTERLIRGQETNFPEIPRILGAYGIDPEAVVAILNDEIHIRGFRLFKGPFNLDTLEGISRCSAYMAGAVDESIPSPEFVLGAALQPNNGQSVPLLDCFWRLKDSVYNTLIRSPYGVLADQVASDYFRHYKGQLARNILLAREEDLWKDHQKLFRRLHEFKPGNHGQTRVVEYVERRFIVDETVPSSDVNQRYVQRKRSVRISYQH